MKISYNWLSDFIKTDLSVDKISEILTDIGLEVEGTETVGISKEDLDNFVVGEVVSTKKHPNADKLKITQVDLGTETVQIVCGAPNVAEGQKVPVATPGAVIKDDKGNGFKIKKAKLRGEASNGMICSQKELKVSNDNSGIWEMNPDLTAGTPLAEVLDTSTDTIFEIGLTPNRADAMSHFGVARDLHAALKSRKLAHAYQEVEIAQLPTSKEPNPIEVIVEDNVLCPRYSGVYIQNIQVADSPQWLQTRLMAIGIIPKNNVVDITNYVLHHLGQPMHAFDADKIKGNQIIVDKAKSAVKFTTLDQEQRELTGEELMIKDAENNLGMAGVMGGLDSAVSEATQNIFLESAYFDPVTIRKTSKAHGINSDSSFRFERGIDPNYTLASLKFASNLILDICGGEIVGQFIDHYPTPIPPHQAILKYVTVDKLLGERLHRDTIKGILASLDIEIISDISNALELEIPAYRVDVKREADLVEEILRIYGFNQIKDTGKVNFSIVAGEGYEKDKIENVLAESLVSLGFSEVMNLSMYKESYNKWFGFDDEKSVEIINALSQDLAYMRRTLLPSLLENVDFNFKRKQDRIQFFELGHSYVKNGDKYKEKKYLSLVITGNQNSSHWDTADKAVDIFYLKGIINQLLQKFKIKNLQWQDGEAVFAKQMLQGEYEKTNLVSLGEFNPKTLKRFDIDKPVYFAEIELDALIDMYQKNKQTVFKPLPKFPQVKRDLALLLDKHITYQEVEQVIYGLGNERIKSVDLFDVYDGDKIAQGKKSYAISLVLQDDQKTMKDSEIQDIMQKVIKSLQKELNTELR